MVAIANKAPAGIPGAITRPDVTVVECAFVNPARPPTAYGVPVKMVDGKLEPWAVGDTGDKLYGVLARVAPSIAGDTGQALADGTPNPEQAQSVVVKGYVNVRCTTGGQPVRGTQVFIRMNDAGEGESNKPGAWSAKKSSNNFTGVSAIWSSDGKDGELITELRLR